MEAAVINVHTIKPIDKETINKSILKTKRLVVADPGWHSFGAASEIITLIMEKNMHIMEANPIRITLPDSHTPMSSSLEKEYYLTDTIEYIVSNGFLVESLQITDNTQLLGINTQEDLSLAEKILVGETGSS